MKILSVFGTRPEAIKLAPVVDALLAAGAEVDCCVTGQHTSLIRPMLGFFGLIPRFDLDVTATARNLPAVAGTILDRVGALLREHGPYDAVVVQGDTTTALAGGLAGFYERVPVAHVEAGLRSGDLTQPFPEEMHRRCLDTFAAHLFAPTPSAAAHLFAEGHPPERVTVTGNTGIDALLMARDRVAGRPLPFDVPEGHKLLLVTAHRRESFGEPLRRIFSAVCELTAADERLTAVVPIHPNPLVREAAALLENRPRIVVVPPLDYPDFVAAMHRADAILTDSGGVQEEAPALGVPLLVTRDTTERPEGVAAGAAELVGTDLRLIVERVTHHLRSAAARRPIMVYGDGSASRRIAEVLVGGRLASGAFRPTG